MFENTLFIIKHDYMEKRKIILQQLLKDGFLIQASRRILFTPELAGEFYKDCVQDKCYMFQMVLLTKGPAEAFILTKQNAIEDLLNKLVCYFGTSNEMDNFVHVTRSAGSAKREITFIFPNYIHEPLPCFDTHKFCGEPAIEPIFSKLYDFVKENAGNPEANWKVQLAAHLVSSHASLPTLKNQCATNPYIGFQNQSQQTEPIAFKDQTSAAKPCSSVSLPSLSSTDSAGLLTSSSCMSCSGFNIDETCAMGVQTKVDFDEEIAKRMEQLPAKVKSEVVEEEEVTEKPQIVDEHIEWVQIYEYEDGQMDSETSDAFAKSHVEVQSKGDGAYEAEGEMLSEAVIEIIVYEGDVSSEAPIEKPEILEAAEQVEEEEVSKKSPSEIVKPEMSPEVSAGGLKPETELNSALQEEETPNIGDAGLEPPADESTVDAPAVTPAESAPEVGQGEGGPVSENVDANQPTDQDAVDEPKE